MTTGAGPLPYGALVDGVDVDAVAAAVLDCPGVDALDGGPSFEVATYLPFRRIAGVRVEARRVLVQVRATWGASAMDVGERVREAVAPLAPDRPIDVVVADLTDPPAPAGWEMPTNREMVVS